MTYFSFRAEFEDGRSIDVVPTYVHPLGVAEIRALAENEMAALVMKVESYDVAVDGERQDGLSKLKMNVTFHQPATIYALVHGGWLPLPFVMPPRFLVDRNVVISLRKLREGKTVANGYALQWWANFFAQGSGMFNPLPYAFEAGYQRKPTMAEFASAYDEGASELLEALPNCHIVKFAKANYTAAYTQLEALDSRNECEIKFLQAVCPIVANRVSRRREVEVANTIVRLADSLKVNRASFTVMTALSCLYEDLHGSPPSIGRQILKPKLVYAEADAFNALNDLRHIELATAGQVYFKNEAFSLCTCDRALALLWCALSPRGEALSERSVEFTFDLTSDLFSRLNEVELFTLKQMLHA